MYHNTPRDANKLPEKDKWTDRLLPMLLANYYFGNKKKNSSVKMQLQFGTYVPVMVGKIWPGSSPAGLWIVLRIPDPLEVRSGQLRGKTKRYPRCSGEAEQSGEMCGRSGSSGGSSGSVGQPWWDEVRSKKEEREGIKKKKGNAKLINFPIRLILDWGRKRERKKYLGGLAIVKLLLLHMCWIFATWMARFYF